MQEDDVVQTNRGRDCSIAEYINAQNDYIALGNKKKHKEQEILDHQCLNSHFSVIGAKYSCTSSMQIDDEMHERKVMLCDAIRFLRYRV